LRPWGIDVVVVQPGPIKTAFFDTMNTSVVNTMGPLRERDVALDAGSNRKGNVAYKRYDSEELDDDEVDGFGGDDLDDDRGSGSSGGSGGFIVIDTAVSNAWTKARELVRDLYHRVLRVVVGFDAARSSSALSVDDFDASSSGAGAARSSRGSHSRHSSGSPKSSRNRARTNARGSGGAAMTTTTSTSTSTTATGKATAAGKRDSNSTTPTRGHNHHQKQHRKSDHRHGGGSNSSTSSSSHLDVVGARVREESGAGEWMEPEDAALYLRMTANAHRAIEQALDTFGADVDQTTRAIEHALLDRRPHDRYLVTALAYVGNLFVALPTRVLDFLTGREWKA
jgi:hypothetical protein